MLGVFFRFVQTEIHNELNKLAALFFRGGGISGRFVLIFLITKKLSLEFQGTFTLMSTNVAILVMILGYELYTFTNQILVKDRNQATYIFKNSLVFFMLAYLLILPFGGFLVYLGFLTMDVFWWFVVLVIAEHLSQEMFRIYIAIEETVFANFLYFLRAGLWSWIIALALFMDYISTIELVDIIKFWTFGAFISVLWGISRMPSIKYFFKEKVDLKWLFGALKFSSSLILSAVLLKVIEYSDRYFIEFYLGKADLGIYAFFFQLSNLVNVIVFTLYISFVYPVIMNRVLDKDSVQYLETKKYLNRRIFVLALGFAIFYVFAIPFLVGYVSNPQLSDNIWLLFLMLISVVLINLSYASHYFLISDKRESNILKITLLATLINLSLNSLLIPFMGLLGAAITLLVTSAFIFVAKNAKEKFFLRKWQ